MKTHILKWIILFAIYVVVLIINLRFNLYVTTGQFYISMLSAAFVVLFGSLFVIGRRLKFEEREFKNAVWNKDNDIIVFLVEKNENETVLKTLNHYVKFPANVKIIVYDDSSDDGTFESLKEFEKKHPGRVEIKPLKKSDKILHSKGHAFESMMGECDADYYLVNDADTVIEFDGLKNMIYYMNSKKIDVVHTSRRNWNTGDSDNILADTEEMMMTLATVLKFNYWNFPGSGYVIGKKAAKKVKFGKYTPGDDTEVGRILRKNKCKVEFFLSVNAYEKAPTTYGGLFRQRSKWYKNTVHQFIEKEMATITLLSFFASNIFFFFVNPLSLANMIFSLFMITMFCIAFSCNYLVAGRKIMSSIFISIASALSYWVNISVSFTYHLFTFPFKRKKIDLGKTIY